LESPEQLEQLAAARSHNKEIIVIASNAAGARLAFNLILSLQAQGIAHYIWLTDDPIYCKALFFSPLRVACAWSSYLAVRSHTRSTLAPVSIRAFDRIVGCMITCWTDLFPQRPCEGL
jgi:hypothetical protein